MLMSEVANPGPRKAPAAQVPNVPGFASVTDAGLRKCGPNTPRVVGSLGLVNWPLPDCETPGTQFGRGEALPVNDLSAPRGYSAKPVCRVKSDAILHPPITALTTES